MAGAQVFRPSNARNSTAALDPHYPFLKESLAATGQDNCLAVRFDDAVILAQDVQFVLFPLDQSDGRLNWRLICD